MELNQAVASFKNKLLSDRRKKMKEILGKAENVRNTQYKSGLVRARRL